MFLNGTTSQLLKTTNLKLGLALLSTVMLAACGGGDSSSSSSPTLNLNAAYTTWVKGGSTIRALLVVTAKEQENRL
jgi:ABC-type glycerol-3-phosphate transport system substrate-binding protein